MHALERIHDGTYGVCENCGNAIGKLRLQASPRATLCLTCKASRNAADPAGRAATVGRSRAPARAAAVREADSPAASRWRSSRYRPRPGHQGVGIADPRTRCDPSSSSARCCNCSSSATRAPHSRSAPEAPGCSRSSPSVVLVADRPRSAGVRSRAGPGRSACCSAALSATSPTGCVREPGRRQGPRRRLYRATTTGRSATSPTRLVGPRRPHRAARAPRDRRRRTSRGRARRADQAEEHG